MFYLFYLRRKNPRSFSIIDRHVHECHKRQKKDWIPNNTSILKLSKEASQEADQEDSNAETEEYVGRKVQELRALRSKSSLILSELKQRVAGNPQ